MRALSATRTRVGVYVVVDALLLGGAGSHDQVLYFVSRVALVPLMKAAGLTTRQDVVLCIRALSEARREKKTAALLC